MTKRIIGYIFITLAIILTIAIIGQIPKLFTVVVSLAMIITGKLDSYQIGNAFGSIIVWVVHFTVTIAFWTYGRKWIKKNSTKSINAEIRT